MNRLADSFSRKIDYLRISITDHCNLNCSYCAPFGGRIKLTHTEILSYEEICRLTKAAVEAGISKVRLTGGEPLMRRGAVELCRMLSGIKKLESLTLTTNGVRLQELAPRLHDAGVQRVNVSLDTLRPERFEKITGRNLLSHVLAGIETAKEVGFHPVKINTVVMHGVNDDEIEDFARLSLEKPYHVRFIELMPFNGSGEHQSLFVPVEEIVRRVKRVGDLSLEPAAESSGPARLCSLPGAKGKVGFIAPLSYHFCGSCNRLRLTADGKLRTCLFSENELDLKEPLRAGASIEELAHIFRLAATQKPHGHSLVRTDSEEYCGRAMQAIGGWDFLRQLLGVKDQGVGIAEENCEVIFEKFQTLPSGEGAKTEGAGLGLAISKGIVEAHEGKIWVERAAPFSSPFPNKVTSKTYDELVRL